MPTICARRSRGCSHSGYCCIRLRPTTSGRRTRCAARGCDPPGEDDAVAEQMAPPPPQSHLRLAGKLTDIVAAAAADDGGAEAVVDPALRGARRGDDRLPDEQMNRFLSDLSCTARVAESMGARPLLVTRDPLRPRLRARRWPDADELALLLSGAARGRAARHGAPGGRWHAGAGAGARTAAGRCLGRDPRARRTSPTSSTSPMPVRSAWRHWWPTR